MIIHDVEQNSPEWDALRLGRITASNFHTLMGKGETRKTLLMKTAAERITGGKCEQDMFSNIHTKRGHGLEDEARSIYHVQTGRKITTVGFVEISKTIGFSPDGLVGEEGGAELKCPDTHTFVKIVSENYIQPIYKTQCQFAMHYMKRKWWDFIAYNPRFPMPMHIMRLEYDKEFGQQIDEAMKRAENDMLPMLKPFNNLLDK